MSYHVADRTNSLDCLVITVADVPIMVFVGVIEEVVVCTGWSSGSCRRARCRRQPVSPSSSPTWRSALTYQFDQPVSDCRLFTGRKYGSSQVSFLPNVEPQLGETHERGLTGTLGLLNLEFQGSGALRIGPVGCQRLITRGDAGSGGASGVSLRFAMYCCD